MPTSRSTLRAVGTFLLGASLGLSPLLAAETPVFSVEGFVVDGAGKPIAGATARYLPDRERPDSALEAQSDEHGAFAITVTRASALGRLQVEKAGFATTLVDRLPPVSPRIAVGPLALLAPVRLEGKITDGAGAPLANARITLALDPDELLAPRAKRASATTGDDGNFVLPDLPPARLFAQFEGPGHRAVTEWIDLRGTVGSVRFETKLIADSPLRGRVVDDAGAPLSDATIERINGTWLGTAGRVSTAGDGAFELASTGVANELFVVRARGRAPRTVDQATLTAGDLVLPIGNRVTAMLLAADGTPATLVAAHFDVFTKEGEGWKHVDGAVRIDDAVVTDTGAWRFALPAGDRGRVRLEASTGRESAAIEVDLAAPPKDGITLTATLAPTMRVEGKVVGPSDLPVPGIRVEIGAPNESSLQPRSERAVLTDANGHFVFEDVAPGSWSIIALSDDSSSAPQLLAVTPDKPPAPVNLTATIAARVRGAVRKSGEGPGRPLALVGMRYQRVGAGGQHIASLMTHCDPDGSYTMSPVPRGAIVIEAIRPPEPLDGVWHDFRAWIDAIDVKDSPNRSNALDPSQIHLDVALEFAPRGVLSGEIKVNGEPRAFGRLGLRKKPTNSTLSTAAPLAPEIVIADSRGRYRAVLEGGGTFEFALFDATLRATREFVFEAGSTQTVDFAVEAGPVSGKIVAARPSAGPMRAVLEGELTEEEAKLRRANPSNLDDTPWATRGEAAIAEDGRYTFPDVVVGRYRVALDDLSRGLARVASEPFTLTSAGIEVPPLEAPPATTLELFLQKDESVAERVPFASAKVVAAEGATPLARTFVGWFVGSEAKVDGLPPGKVRVEIVVFGKWNPVAPQEITIDPNAAEHRLTFTVEPRL